MPQLIIAAASLPLLSILFSGGFLACLEFRTPGEYLDVDGARLYYTVQGEGEPVILVHGFGANSDLNWRWPGVIDTLAENHKVIAFDCRGHGLSSKPTDPALYGEEMVKDVIRVMDHFGIAKAHVVGYSMGGYITLKLLTEYPERLISAAPCAAGWTRPDAENRALLQDVVKSLESGDGFTALARRLEPPGTEPNMVKLTASNFLMRLINDTDALAGCMGGFLAFEADESKLRAVNVPVLTIIGGADPLKADVDAMKGLIPNHEVVVVDGTTHLTTIFDPKFPETLKAFVDKHSGSPAA